MLIKIYDIVEDAIYQDIDDGELFINVKADVDNSGKIVDFSFFITEPEEGQTIIRHFKSKEGLYPIFRPVAVEKQ